MRDLINPITSADFSTLAASVSGTVSIGYSGQLRKYTLTAETTLSPNGTFFPLDTIVIIASGDFLLKVDDTTFSYEGMPDGNIDAAGVLLNYNGIRKNKVTFIYTGDSTFAVTVENL